MLLFFILISVFFCFNLSYLLSIFFFFTFGLWEPTSSTEQSARRVQEWAKQPEPVLNFFCCYCCCSSSRCCCCCSSFFILTLMKYLHLVFIVQGPRPSPRSVYPCKLLDAPVFRHVAPLGSAWLPVKGQQARTRRSRHVRRAVELESIKSKRHPALFYT